jgi:polycystin 1L2
MRDNHPGDKYLYEITIETGPMTSHATSSNIRFILDGDNEDSDIRCVSDKERVLFKKGALDGFIMAVPRPLGELNTLRVWTDSCGLGEMSAWYLLGYI